MRGVTCRLLDRAISLADQLKVRFLELRKRDGVLDLMRNGAA